MLVCQWVHSDTGRLTRQFSFEFRWSYCKIDTTFFGSQRQEVFLTSQLKAYSCWASCHHGKMDWIQQGTGEISSNKGYAIHKWKSIWMILVVWRTHGLMPTGFIGIADHFRKSHRRFACEQSQKSPRWALEHVGRGLENYPLVIQHGNGERTIYQWFS